MSTFPQGPRGVLNGRLTDDAGHTLHLIASGDGTLSPVWRDAKQNAAGSASLEDTQLALAERPALQHWRAVPDGPYVRVLPPVARVGVDLLRIEETDPESGASSPVIVRHGGLDDDVIIEDHALAPMIGERWDRAAVRHFLREEALYGPAVPVQTVLTETATGATFVVQGTTRAGYQLSDGAGLREVGWAALFAQFDVPTTPLDAARAAIAAERAALNRPAAPSTADASPAP